MILNLIPKPVLAALILLAAALAGWQTWELADARADLIKANSKVSSLELEIERANTKAQQQAADNASAILKAQNEAKEREQKLRAAADSARAESDGLRNDAAQLRDQLAQASREAAIERASALATVLGQCAARYQVLSERSDRHVNDLRTLIEAWPTH